MNAANLLKDEIDRICKGLSECGEESIFVSVNLEKTTCFVMGSDIGLQWLDGQSAMVQKFYHHCAVRLPDFSKFKSREVSKVSSGRPINDFTEVNKGSKSRTDKPVSNFTGARKRSKVSTVAQISKDSKESKNTSELQVSVPNPEINISSESVNRSPVNTDALPDRKFSPVKITVSQSVENDSPKKVFHSPSEISKSSPSKHASPQSHQGGTSRSSSQPFSKQSQGGDLLISSIVSDFSKRKEPSNDVKCPSPDSQQTVDGQTLDSKIENEELPIDSSKRRKRKVEISDMDALSESKKVKVQMSDTDPLSESKKVKVQMSDTDPSSESKKVKVQMSDTDPLSESKKVKDQMSETDTSPGSKKVMLQLSNTDFLPESKKVTNMDSCSDLKKRQSVETYCGKDLDKPLALRHTHKRPKSIREDPLKCYVKLKRLDSEKVNNHMNKSVSDDSSDSHKANKVTDSSLTSIDQNSSQNENDIGSEFINKVKDDIVTDKIDVTDKKDEAENCENFSSFTISNKESASDHGTYEDEDDDKDDDSGGEEEDDNGDEEEDDNSEEEDDDNGDEEEDDNGEEEDDYGDEEEDDVDDLSNKITSTGQRDVIFDDTFLLENYINNMKSRVKRGNKRGIGHIPCPTCDLTFNTMKGFRRHQRNCRVVSCPRCNHKCQSIEELREHFECHRGEELHKCQYCNKEFLLIKALKKHEITHSTKPKYSCPLCSKSVYTPSFLRSHLRTIHNEKRYVCVICGKLFETDFEYNKHSTVHAPSKRICPFFCKKCGKKFQTLKGLKTHNAKTHNSPDEKICDYCLEYFSDDVKYRKHLKEHDLDKPNTCIHCRQSFDTKELLNEHIYKIHNEGMSYICEVCGFEASDKLTLKYHKYEHEDRMPYVCEVCGEGFILKSKYNSHITSHTKERLFVCEICGKQFKRRQNLNSHRMVHSEGVKCQFCERVFKSTGGLNYHIVRYHDNKVNVDTYKKTLIKCEICNKYFPSRPSYNQHKSAHITEKSWACPVCGRRFKTEKQMKQHEGIHSETKPFFCIPCDYGFTIKSCWDNHLKSEKHKIQSSKSPEVLKIEQERKLAKKMMSIKESIKNHNDGIQDTVKVITNSRVDPSEGASVVNFPDTTILIIGENGQVEYFAENIESTEEVQFVEAEGTQLVVQGTELEDIQSVHHIPPE